MFFKPKISKKTALDNRQVKYSQNFGFNSSQQTKKLSRQLINRKTINEVQKNRFSTNLVFSIPNTNSNSNHQQSPHSQTTNTKSHL